MLDLPRWFSLNRRELERQFALSAVELKEIIALDGIDLLPEQSLLRVRSHDLHGPLPEITLAVDVGDRLETFDRLSREAAKLCAMVRIRRELAEALPSLAFLPPTVLDSKCVVGVQWANRTVLSEASDFIDACHRLWRKAVRRFP